VDVRSLSRDVFLFTFGFELVGAILLYILWAPKLGVSEALWPAIFHSVSAFCNAGFSTFSDSMMGFQTNGAILLTLSSLIVVGGIGFLTLEELYLQRKAAREQRLFHLSVHSRIALAMAALLLAVGTVLYMLFEWNVTFAEIPIWARPLNAIFMSANSRTAGFNSIDFSQASDSSNFLTVILMAIGGSPGSMAGGMKTTTFALIGLLAWSRFRGVTITSIWGRSIPEETIQRAVGLFVVVFGILTAAIFAYTVTEVGARAHEATGGLFLMHMFEASSAFNTVGLSMGATADLSTPGRWITTLLMYMGRVGPLTFAAALALKTSQPSRDFRYAYEDVVVG
jgi:trk system potassium uptake protein TrkH